MDGERESASFIDGNGGRPNPPCTVIPAKLQVLLWGTCFLTALMAVIISVVSLKNTCVNVNVSPDSKGKFSFVSIFPPFSQCKDKPCTTKKLLLLQGAVIISLVTLDPYYWYTRLKDNQYFNTIRFSPNLYTFVF